MKLSRLVGAAVTWGTLFGGGVVHAQVNYYTASNMTYPYVAPAPVAQHSTHPSAYPSTSGYGYSVASVPDGYTQFAGPANSSMSRLPASPTPILVGNPTAVATAPSSTLGSILASPSSSDGAIFTGGNSPVIGAGTTPTYAGIGYGAGAGTGTAGSNVPGCGVGSSAFQPFTGTDGACGAGCEYFGPNRWYGGAYGLILSRNNQRHFTFSFDTANEDQQFTDAKDTNVDWGGGFAAIAGHYFNCGQNAIEAVYWGWFPEEANTTTLGANIPGDLNGIFNWDSLTYNALNMGAFVNDAEVHALFHANEVHNVELNLLSFTGGYGGNMGGPSPVRYTLLAGMRYFRYRDHLTFRADPNDTAFTGEVDEIFYDISTVNNLTGFQIGGVGTYCVGPRLSLNAGTKVGLFGNHIRHSSQIGGIAGVAVINNGPNAGLAFDVHNSKNDVAFLSELFVGCGYSISNRWSASAGYRAIGVTGLAEATDQIYPDLRGINDLFTIESQSSMILHGAYFGAQYCF